MALYHTVCMMCCFRFDNSLRTRLTILRSKMAPWSIEILRTEWQHYAPPRMSIRIRSFGDPQPSNKLFCSEKLMLQFIFIKKSNIRRHMYSVYPRYCVPHVYPRYCVPKVFKYLLFYKCIQYSRYIKLTFLLSIAFHILPFSRCSIWYQYS